MLARRGMAEEQAKGGIGLTKQHVQSPDCLQSPGTSTGQQAGFSRHIYHVEDDCLRPKQIDEVKHALRHRIEALHTERRRVDEQLRGSAFFVALKSADEPHSEA